jgi:hypothetical protein
MRRALWLLAATLLSGCGRSAEVPDDGFGSAANPDTARVIAADLTRDISAGDDDAEFDPGAVAVGDSVGGLEIVVLDVRRVFDDSVWAGRVQFRGRLTVDGVYRRHFDYPEPAALCFHVSGEARKRVPRFPPDSWSGPNRQTWFCFTNDDVARTLLGDGAVPVEATVVIDRYSLIREFSDVFDVADLVEVVARR